jgi:hypothetical protein
MDLTNALCPNCRKTVTFVREGNFNRCPECGAMYRLSPQWRGAQPRRGDDSAGLLFGQFLSLLFKTLLIMVAVVVVGVSVLFAGCLLTLSHH